MSVHGYLGQEIEIQTKIMHRGHKKTTCKSNPVISGFWN
jgi:hypothetical protein